MACTGSKLNSRVIRTSVVLRSREKDEQEDKMAVAEFRYDNPNLNAGSLVLRVHDAYYHMQGLEQVRTPIA